MTLTPFPSKPRPELASRRSYAALPLSWAAVVLVLTLTPADEMPRTPVWKLLSFDTAAHAGVFVVLAGLSWFSLRRQRHWPRLARHAGVAVLVGSTLFGGLIEVLQVTMRLGRHGEWTDLISDAIGAVLAVGAATAWAGWRGTPTRSLAAALWLGGSLGVACMGSAAPARAQDIARARRTIEKLASPGMHGRGYVAQGEHRAAAYLRGRFRELALQPLAPDFTQSFTLPINTFPGAMRLAVSGTLGNAELRPGQDFIAAPASGSGQVQGRPWRLDSLVFTNPDTAAAWQRRLRLTRPLLLLTARDQARLPTLPVPLRQRIDSAAWLVLVPKLTASLAGEQAPRPRLEVLSPRWPADAVVQARIDARLQPDYQTQNLAALVRGTTQPDSFLVVSAHYDHLGMMGRKTYFPGANDNASGVALLLELAAHYARPENRPAYSVVFLLFGAEEAGLVGSRYFVAHPLIPLPNIRFLVNLDLLGTGEQGATVVNGRLLEAPYRRLAALNDAHRYLPGLSARGRAANSDHFPFSEAGVPAFFIYTRGGSTAYHDVNDRPAALSLAGFAGAFRLVRDFLNGLGAEKSTVRRE
ncbi:M20/M25/M40 family metallo-hydrolase [Hymenobacter sp. BT664]|uniref:M20/M25/M40 family metallo-hydrolase n=1 Tax=Hymenobacter montanus TaxID=2771359 RepID=A0A927BFT6_9BACT|nr:VanZ family protein [Hymenobacter montanus]MBD2770090.1 M20/M25/M40 family metallo-hydrolase [Hymenobacter montanus]